MFNSHATFYDWQMDTKIIQMTRFIKERSDMAQVSLSFQIIYICNSILRICNKLKELVKIYVIMQRALDVSNTLKYCYTDYSLVILF